MMKKILLLLFCTISIFASAQTKELQAVITSPNWHTFYSGIENYIYISVPGYNPDAVSATMTGGIIKKVPHTINEFIVSPSLDVQDAELTVSVKSGATQKKVSTEKYKIEKLPCPVLKIGSFEGGKVSSAEISQQTTVYAESPVYIPNVAYELRGFTYYIIPHTGNLVPFSERVDGNTITPYMKERLTSLRSGDKVILMDASAFLSDKGVPTRQATVYTIR